MNNGIEILAVVLIVTILLVVAVLVEQARRKAWVAMSGRFGLRPCEGDPLEQIDRFSEFGVLGVGDDRQVIRTMEGERKGRPIVLFEYRYTTGSGKNRSTHYRTCIGGELDFDAPGLVIRPEHLGDRIANLFGFDDIDFEFDEFNRAFQVTGEDKKFAYDICHARMMEILLAGRHLCWELRGRRRLAHSKSARWDEPQIAAALNLVDGFREHLPEYLERRSTP